MKTYQKIIVLFILCTFGCSEDKTKNKIQNPALVKYLDVLVENRDFSGIVLIGNNEEILSTYISGYSDFYDKKKHDNNSQFAIASISKTFTSAAILKLRDDGKIKLEDKIGKYLPEFKYGDKITILHLLRHESGLQNVDYEIKSPLSSEQLISELEKNTLFFEPGTNGRYSNAGFTVLARIIEVVSGLSYNEYLQTNFLLPLDMTITGDLSTQKKPKKLSEPNFPSPAPELVKPVSDINYSLSLGSGSIYSTAEDLWKWGNAIKNKSQVDVFSEGYPYGWGRDSIAGTFALNQTGMIDGFVSSLSIFPKEDIVIVLLSNIQNAMWVEWTKDIAKIFFNDTSEIHYPVKRKLRLKPLENPDQYVGIYKLNANRVIHIKNIDGNLYLNFNEGNNNNYLTPLHDNSFDLRSDVGNIIFESKDSLKLTQLTSWGGTFYYIRQK